MPADEPDGRRVDAGGRINLVVALRSEARPLIDRLRLVPRADGPFPTFTDNHGALRLVVAGVGRARAAAAVAHLAAGQSDDAWLNVGIAGHRELAIGELRMAHKIRCDATDRCWYPQLVFEPPTATAGFRTVDRACADFPSDDLYDMEAAGYAEIAARFAPYELIHALKVVSDNASEGHRRLTAERATELVADSLDAVESLIDALLPLSARLKAERAEPPGLEALLEFAHFTATQRRQLRRLLRRWAVVNPDEVVQAWVEQRGAADGAEILGAIAQRIGGIAPRFGA